MENSERENYYFPYLHLLLYYLFCKVSLKIRNNKSDKNHVDVSNFVLMYQFFLQAKVPEHKKKYK